MIYLVHHTISCSYTDRVPRSRGRLWMTPRELPHQAFRAHELRLDPEPTTLLPLRDAYDNLAHDFAIDLPHDYLRAEAISEVELKPRELIIPVDTPSWETVRDQLREAPAEIAVFCHPTPLVDCNPALHAFAAPHFRRRQPILESLMDFNQAIHHQLEYVSGATSIRTTASEVLALRAGICQDFAHLMLAGCRSLGLAACYVSGYLRSFAPAGEKQIGTDEMHAWVSVWCGPAHGWVELDPIMDMAQLPGHITVARGRDYTDVPPLSGSIQSNAAQALTTIVHIHPLQETP